jgi:hypothetical protein
MTCEEFEHLLLDSRSHRPKAGRLPGATETTPLEDHARKCTACATRMAEIAGLENALHQLRVSMMGTNAPPSVENKLLASFRENASRRRFSLPALQPWRITGFAAGAVVLVVFFSSFLATIDSNRIGTEIMRPPSPGLSGLALGALNERHQTATRSLRNVSRNGATIASKSGSASGRSQASPPNEEFSLNGGGSIVRVTLPLSSLTAMGLPVHAELSDARVTADVWMDPFGDVTKVRLVAVDGPNRE